MQWIKYWDSVVKTLGIVFLIKNLIFDFSQTLHLLRLHLVLLRHLVALVLLPLRRHLAPQIYLSDPLA